MIARFVRRAMVWLVQTRARLPGAYHKNRIAIIAGAGDLPLRVVQGAKSQGLDVRIFALEEPERFSGYDTTSISLANPRDVLRAFFKVRAKSLCLIGGVTLNDEARRMWQGTAQDNMRPDEGGAAQSGSGQDTGDSALSHLLAKFCDQMNVDLRNPAEFLQDGTSEVEVLGAANEFDAKLAGLSIHAAIELGRLDIGQAVVGFGRRIVAVEGTEGTDRLLERVKDMRAAELFDTKTEGMLVKWPKPDQLHDIDLPAIGPNTVQNCAQAGIGTIIVQKGHCLIAEKQQTDELAKQLNISIHALAQKPDLPE